MSAVIAFGNPVTMKQVLQAEREMLARGTPVEIPVKHYFANKGERHGAYAREITIPADTVLTGKIHKTEQINFLLKGEITVSTPTGMVKFTAPATIVSPPGTKRIAYTHTEVVWTTVHATEKTEISEIEAEFIAQNEQEWLAYAAAKQLEVKP